MLNTTDSFGRASSHYQAGQFPQAEFLLRQLLAQNANHAPALHLLGVVAYQTGQASAALGYWRRSS